MLQPIIAVVTRETRMDELRARWATTRQAQFRLEQAARHEIEFRKRRLAKARTISTPADEMALQVAAAALADNEEYTGEDQAYQNSITRLMQSLDLGIPVKALHRSFLPNFDFSRCMAVVVIGQDGLVANAAKYVGDVPIIGVNPNPAAFDGVLLPFLVENARDAVQKTLAGKAQVSPVTLAEVNTNDGQRMLAFNDFFVGTNSHVSARYTLEIDGHVESQSSSGILISTGAGSTGWLSSLFNMVEGFAKSFGMPATERLKIKWSDRKLVWSVREPFRSKHSSADLVTGILEANNELIVGSQMPIKGVIFSDGIESDAIEFGSGTIARFSVSKQQAQLVVRSS
jgi:NAD kinase